MWRIMFFVLLLGVISCEPSPSPPPLDADVPPRISDRVRLLPKEVIDVSVIESASIFIPNNVAGLVDAIAPGDIVVGAHEEGLLRRVVSTLRVDGGIVFETVAAALTDAIIDGDIDFEESAEFVSDQSGAIIYSDPVAQMRFGDSFTRIRPRVVFHLRIRGGRVVRFEFSASGESHVKYVVSSTSSGNVFVNVSKDLMKKTLFVYKGAIGWFPVIVVVEGALGVGVGATLGGSSDYVAGAERVSTVEAGVRFEGEWEPVFSTTDRISYVGPYSNRTAKASIEAKVGAILRARLYYVFSPYVELTAGVTLEAEVSDGSPPKASWCAAYVVAVNAGLNVGIEVAPVEFGTSFSKTLWQKKIPFSDDAELDSCAQWDVAQWDAAQWQ